jgi:hypothetical protein
MWQDIVRSWGLTDLVKALSNDICGPCTSSVPRKRLSEKDLLNALGLGRINALTTYCGMSREDVLNTLSKQLPEFIVNEVLWTAFHVATKPGTKSAILEAIRLHCGFGGLAR